MILLWMVLGWTAGIAAVAKMETDHWEAADFLLAVLVVVFCGATAGPLLWLALLF